MKPVKIPKQIFVVSENRPEYTYPVKGDWSIKVEEKHNFGFLHPHEPSLKADTKRKQTQMDWAYQGKPYQVGDVWWEKGADFHWANSLRISTPYDRPIDPLYAPKIWDNVPLDGFKLIDTVNRYRGNKLFKVLDPRGIEFEITVNSLFHILCEGTVKNGVILDKCIWQAGKNLVIA